MCVVVMGFEADAETEQRAASPNGIVRRGPLVL